ncbi:hypothetical protein RCL1_001266 [Eukaryota sp. TZLM3-RCL]
MSVKLPTSILRVVCSQILTGLVAPKNQTVENLDAVPVAVFINLLSSVSLRFRSIVFDVISQKISELKCSISTLHHINFFYKISQSIGSKISLHLIDPCIIFSHVSSQIQSWILAHTNSLLITDNDYNAISQNIDDVARLIFSEDIKILHCNFINEVDFNFLNQMTQLQELAIEVSHTISYDLSPLIVLRNLSLLNLEGFNDVSHVSFVSSIKNLNTLVLVFFVSLSDLTPLSDLEHLESLYLCENGVTDLSPLSSLSRVVQLDLYLHDDTIDISFLHTWKRLKELTLFQVPDGLDLSPIGSLSTLRLLHMKRANYPNSVRCDDDSILAKLISHLVSLEDLFLTDFYITNLNFLTPTNVLVELSFSACALLTDISAASYCKMLSVLRLEYCDSLADLSPLVGVETLCLVHIHYCTELTNLSPLSDISNLKSLILDSVEITDLSKDNLSSLSSKPLVCSDSEYDSEETQDESEASDN